MCLCHLELGDRSRAERSRPTPGGTSRCLTELTELRELRKCHYQAGVGPSAPVSHACLPSLPPASGPGLRAPAARRRVGPQREQPERRGEARAPLSSPPPARLFRLQVEGCRAAGCMSVCGRVVAAGGPDALMEAWRPRWRPGGPAGGPAGLMEALLP
ncbi:hypothetical protein EYF80_050125 [Liparis tanakae]|uniref:Uncharacterized protein n=1 Tax=Liparis tanakae TaxID=230148 RepID=A0A4Z2FEX1_9TELE|nr:hypothetical protein EYF80_050125 [Liparis tanakae]